jgi:hypothetical protein
MGQGQGALPMNQSGLSRRALNTHRGFERSVFLAVLALSIGCQPYQGFAPAGTETFESRPAAAAVPLLESAPPSGHLVIGYAECFAVSTKQALPMLQNQARKHGGEALLNLTSQPRSGLASSYRAAVIRFTEVSKGAVP